MSNLYQRLVRVMQTMGAVGKSGQATYGDRYAYHKIDDIDDKLRVALVEHGVVATVVEIRDRKLEHFNDVDKYGKTRTNWYAECLIVIELVNADDPTDRSTIVGWGQGLDSGDKATGKAISYAAKAAYLSAFHLRGQPDNEADNIARNPEPAPVSEEAQSWIDALQQCDCVEDLVKVGSNIKDESADVQNAVRPHYAARLKLLKQGKVGSDTR